MAEIPKFVPLPEVLDYTDDVIFGGLNLPVGFDDEKLGVNINAFNRVRSIAGLGVVSISSISGKTEEYDIGISSVDASGAATFGMSAKPTKQSLSEGDVSFWTGNSLYGKADLSITLNNTETDQRIKGSSTRKGAMDAALQAKILNQGIKTGLYSGSKQANFNEVKAKQSLRYYGFMQAIVALGASNDIEHIMRVEAGIIGLGPVIMNLAILRNASMDNIAAELKGERKINPLDILKLYRQSTCVGVATDRYLGAAAVIAVSKFIEVKE